MTGLPFFQITAYWPRRRFFSSALLTACWSVSSSRFPHRREWFCCECSSLGLLKQNPLYHGRISSLGIWPVTAAVIRAARRSLASAIDRCWASISDLVLRWLASISLTIFFCSSRGGTGNRISKKFSGYNRRREDQTPFDQRFTSATNDLDRQSCSTNSGSNFPLDV